MSVPTPVDPAAPPRVVAMHVPEGKVVVLGDLPLGVLGRIAGEANIQFSSLFRAPLLAPWEAIDALYRACCDHAGVTAKETLTSREMYDAVHMVDDVPTAADQTTG